MLVVLEVVSSLAVVLGVCLLSVPFGLIVGGVGGLLWAWRLSK